MERKKQVMVEDNTSDVELINFTSVIGAMNLGLTIQDKEYNIIYQNKILSDIFGHVGEKCYKIYEGKDQICVGCPVKKAYKDGKYHSSERKVTMPNGEIAYWENTANPIRNDKGEINSCLEIARNITESKKAELALKDSEEKYRTLFSSTSDGVYATNSEGNFTMANTAMGDILGCSSSEELIDMPVLWFWQNQKDRKKFTMMLLEKKSVSGYPIKAKKISGENIFVEATSRILEDNEGKFIGIDGIIRDVTKRKKEEEALKRKLMKFNLEEGTIYLSEENSPILSLEAFDDLSNIDYSGVIFSRMQEIKFKDKITGEFDFFKISEVQGKKTISPYVSELISQIKNISAKTVVLIDRLDYIISKNGFKKVLLFIEELNDIIFISNIIVLLSIDPRTISKSNLIKIRKETEKIKPLDGENLNEKIMMMLRFIYKQNMMGVKPSKKDILIGMNLSKPTINKRINILKSKGYLIQTGVGRKKLLELTGEGKNLF